MNNNLGKGSIKDRRLKKDQKLHQFYAAEYGEEMNIKRGFEVESHDYQIRLACAARRRIKSEMQKHPIKFILKIGTMTITYRGDKTKHDIIKKYAK